VENAHSVPSTCLEFALEDAMLSIVMFSVALKAPWLGDDGLLLANNWMSVILAFGKLGAVGAAMLVEKYWTPPSDPSKYRHIFGFTLLGGMSVFLLPLAFHIGASNVALARACVFLSVLLFFSLSTVSKIAFQTLMQQMIAEEEKAGSVFSLVGVIATIMSAVAPWIFQMIWQHSPTPEIAAKVTAGIYAGHGVLEVAFGPWLIAEKKHGT
jgi:hypothetical protein